MNFPYNVGTMPATLKLDEIDACGNQLAIRWSVLGYSFTTSYWYDSVDFDILRAQIGEDWLDRVIFHIALFEINKGYNFRPEIVELGDWARFLTQPLAQLWYRVLQGVWAQWRWQNDDMLYMGPRFAEKGIEVIQAQLDTRLETKGEGRFLAFCGGGKDSLVVSHLLDSIDAKYDSLSYSHSVYGNTGPQHELINRLLSHTHTARKHEQSVFDDSMDLPDYALDATNSSGDFIAAETPSSIFASLPIAIANGMSYLGLGHERSANHGNLTWSKTGEDINHQWGKSFEAESLMNEYISSYLIKDLKFFSLLQGIYDPLIFWLLNSRLDAVPYTHSCNIRKPWCMECPKCAYVWLNYKAWLPWGVVDPIFGAKNLLDSDENQIWYRQMLGLENHTPFECIGQIHESRLAMELCRARGLRGAAMDAYSAEVKDFDWERSAIMGLSVSAEQTGIPPRFQEMLVPVLKRAAAGGLEYARNLLG